MHHITIWVLEELARPKMRSMIQAPIAEDMPCLARALQAPVPVKEGGRMKHLLAGAAFATALLTAFAAVSQTPLKKAKFGLGTLALNISYPWAMLPPVLGYWKDEGYDVEVFPVQSSLQGIQLMSAGNIDFVEANSAPIMQAAADHKIALKTIMVNTV